MTDNTKPEAMDLADWLEAVGGSPSAKRCAALLREQYARIAELESELEAVGAGGVQALSAAQAVHASVKGAMWFTKKPVTIQAIQWTGDNLREVITFTDGPPDTRSHHAGMAWDAYRDLVARDGLKIYTLEGKMLASPGDWIIRGVKGELYPCKPDIFQETYAAASPTPPVEQQAAKVAPAIGDELRDTLVAVSAAIAEQDDRTAQKMIREILEASPTPPAEQQAAPKAAPGVGNSGFDHKTAADLLNGKTVSDEAVRKFVAASRWAHDERAALSATLLAMHGVLTSREAEIALLKKALLEAEAAPQQEAQEPVWDGKLSDAMRNALDALYLQCGHEIARDISHQVRKECEAIYTSYTTAKRMYQAARDRLGAIETAQPQPDPFAAPQPAPAPLSDDAKDAARYRWLRNKSTVLHGTAWLGSATAYQRDVDFLRRDDALAALDAAIDAAIAAQGEKP